MWTKLSKACSCCGEGISPSLSRHPGEESNTSGVSWEGGFWKRTRDELEQAQQPVSADFVSITALFHVTKHQGLRRQRL